MINRRQFLKNIGLGAAAMAVSQSDSLGMKLFSNNTVNAKITSVTNNKPNLLIIHTDEHNFRTLGCYRQTLSSDQALMWGPQAIVETPNIDWIAANGALCTHFYANTPVCSPSRAAFVSGKYPQNTPIETNDTPMSDDIVTFAKVLKDKGYATGYAGKWHLDGDARPGWDPARNFGFEDNRYMFNRGHWKKLALTLTGAKVAAVDANGDPTYNLAGADETSFTTDFLSDRAMEFIRAHKDQPFCYMLAIPDPHDPDDVRAPYANMYNNLSYIRPATFTKSTQGLPSWAVTAEAGDLSQSVYFGMIKCIDDNVGQILQVLRDLNLIDKTIVIFTSDHGDLRGEHHRQNKGVPLEASAKVPFVIRYPGKIQPGTIVNETISCVDFLPTILSLMNVATAGQEEGRDASQLFLTGQVPQDWKDVSFLRGTGSAADEKWIAAVTKRYKLVTSVVTTDVPWLYDLQTDPGELINYFNDPSYNQVRSFLAKELLAYGTKYNDSRMSSPKIQAELTAVVI